MNKPGYKSTEFYVALLAMIIGALFASGAISDGSLAAKVLGTIATVLGQLGYTVSRTLTKSSAVADAQAKA